MEVKGRTLLLGAAVLVVLFMVGVVLVGNSLRQEYHVLSTGDTERWALDADDTRVVWLEQAGIYGKTMAYDLGTRKRVELESFNASLDQPIALGPRVVAWAEGNGGGPAGNATHRVAFHDFINLTTWRLGGAGDDLTLPGRTMSDGFALVQGTFRGEQGVWRYDVVNATLTRMPLEAPKDSRMLLAGPRILWLANGTLRGYDVATGVTMPELRDTAPIGGFDADADRVVWHVDPRPAGPRRVHLANISGDGWDATTEVSAFPRHQWGPALNGSRLIFIQDDGLVRAKNLDSGVERVLPARDQENIGLRLTPHWAVWLSGTIQGHNILAVPL